MQGSGAPNPNRHPDQPLCHAVCAAAIFFDVVAKVCTVATNLLKCCTSSNGLAWVLGAGATGFDFAVGVGSRYTWSAEGATGSGFFFELGSGIRIQIYGV